jgi:pilus assembly protein CpaE
VTGDAAYSPGSAPASKIASNRESQNPTSSRARAMPRLNIHAFCEQEDTAAAIEGAARDRRLSKARVSVQMGGAERAFAYYRTAATPDLTIVESRLDRRDMIAELDRLSELCDPATKVMVIGHASDVLLHRELLRRGVSEYAAAPVGAMQIIESVGNICAGPETKPLGQILAFIGAKGGAGSSTVCHNTAFAIASTLASEVVIADFDLPFGTAGLDFNQDPLHGIAEALASAERFDSRALGRLLSRCSDHLSLFAAPGTLDRAYDLAPSSCDTVLDVTRETVPWIAVDLPHLWTEWTRQVVSRADHVAITAVPDLANLRNTKNLVDQLKDLRPNDCPPVLVLNQVGMPKRPEITIEDFADAVELEPRIVINFDARLFGTAANNGQMIEEMSSKSKAAEAFRKLADILTGRPEQRPEHQSILALILASLRFARMRG